MMPFLIAFDFTFCVLSLLCNLSLVCRSAIVADVAAACGRSGRVAAVVAVAHEGTF
jgi:hypothetical protein